MKKSLRFLIPQMIYLREKEDRGEKDLPARLRKHEEPARTEKLWICVASALTLLKHPGHNPVKRLAFNRSDVLKYRAAWGRKYKRIKTSMRIIVPIKQVPETNAVKMDEATGTMIREGVEAIINPLDLYAIEAALLLREQYGGEIIALSMGPSKAISALREAIAMGIDQAVLLSDRAFAGSDTWATGYALSRAIQQIGRKPKSPGTNGLDLILCGERATDGDTGQVGPGIASFLNLPVATYVSKIEQIERGVCRVHRLVEEGYEILEVQLPAVLTVVKEAANPRLPTLRGKQRAKKVEIPTWGPEELQVPVDELGLKGSPTRVVRIFKPKVAREGRKLPAGDEQAMTTALDQLLIFLQRKELL